jgi:hypothetical protein
MASVVTSSPATDAAPCKAARTTFAGNVLDGETMDHGAIVPARGDVEIKGIFLGIAAEGERSFTR